MDRPGRLQGGVVSEVRNLHSQRLYVVSTAPELGQDYWSTAVFPAVQEKRFWGLSSRSVVDVTHPIISIIRNAKAEAHEAHAQVRQIVSTEPESTWLELLPNAEPPDGWSPGAEARLHGSLGENE
jgi:hypothetical protein